jgi:5'-deoxy-5'-methylthioadenosine phosphorylase
VKLGIIGGSLLKNIDRLTQVTEERIKTPFGEPSANFIMGKIDNVDIIYLNRHGLGHHLAPHHINYRANMFALKLLEVTHIIAIAAVGGITERMSPMRCVVPDQIVDYTYGRLQTFNDGNDEEVKHIDFSYPFDEDLRKKIISAIKMSALEAEIRATYAATQGPRLETIAEIKRLQQDGCDIVGMTAMPEAALARELDIDYANLSLVVNWAAGAGVAEGQTAEIISMDEIKQRMSDGNAIMETIVYNLIDEFS